MRGLIAKYNRNRKLIWFIIGMCVAIYALIHILNEYIGQKLYEENVGEIKTDMNFYQTNYSVMSNEKITEKKNRENTEIIKDFINYCNEGKVQEAYGLLSEECKQVLFPTLETFKTEYVDKYFSESKTFNLQLWNTIKSKYIYRVELIEDMLSTGRSSNVKGIDYYTINVENDNMTLNIAKFIEKNTINTKAETDYISIIVESEDIYVDYVDVNIEAENKTNFPIILDGGAKGDSVYLKDTKDIGYASYLFEETEEDLTIRKNLKKNFKIKFDKEYSENINIKEIGFLDIICNYNDEETSQKLVIEIMNDKK